MARPTATSGVVAEQAEIHPRESRSGRAPPRPQDRRRRRAGSPPRWRPPRRGDDRLRQRDDGLHESGTPREQLHIVTAAAVAVVAVRLHLLKVMAGAERRSVTGEHNDASLIVSRDRVEFGDQRLDHIEAQRIEVVRRGQGQGDDSVVVVATEEVAQKERQGHEAVMTYSRSGGSACGYGGISLQRVRHCSKWPGRLPEERVLVTGSLYGAGAGPSGPE